MERFEKDSRVYYKDEGETDAGTITEVSAQGDSFYVEWDNDDGHDWFYPDQLALLPDQSGLVPVTLPNFGPED